MESQHAQMQWDWSNTLCGRKKESQYDMESRRTFLLCFWGATLIITRETPQYAFLKHEAFQYA